MITSKLDQEYLLLTQYRKAAEARALIQPVRTDINRIVIELKAIRDSGVFDQLDPEIKTVLLVGWDILQVAKASFEETEIAEFLDWKP